MGTDNFYTLDEFIERLESLRGVCGGDTPITISVVGTECFVPAAVEVSQVSSFSPTEDSAVWRQSYSGNTIQILNIF